MGNRRLIYGVGINDSIHKTYSMVNVNDSGMKKVSCPLYDAWRHMMQRCYSDHFRIKRPSYLGCSVSKDWHVFSAFRYWMEGQQWKGNHLDKDILIPGNKVYSREACVFISPELNAFLIDRSADRGEYPLGVHADKESNKFKAQCSNPLTGKNEHIGRYNSSEEAHEAWRARKHEHACWYADQQTDPRIAQALRMRYAKKETA